MDKELKTKEKVKKSERNLIRPIDYMKLDDEALRLHIGAMSSFFDRIHEEQTEDKVDDIKYLTSNT